MSNKSKLDLEQLQRELRNLHRWQPLYKLLKRELTTLGYWRLQPRGSPEKGYLFGIVKHNKEKELGHES